MKLPHTPWHWAAVAAVLAVALLTLTDAHGQKAGSAASFEGRPVIPGAQSDLGAMSGPPQGGLGVQSTEDLRLPRPGPLRDRGPVVPRDPGLDRPSGADRPQPLDPDGEVQPRREHHSVDVAPRRGDESGIRKQQRTRDKVEKGLRRGEERPAE